MCLVKFFLLLLITTFEKWGSIAARNYSIFSSSSFLGSGFPPCSVTLCEAENKFEMEGFFTQDPRNDVEMADDIQSEYSMDSQTFSNDKIFHVNSSSFNTSNVDSGVLEKGQEVLLKNSHFSVFSDFKNDNVLILRVNKGMAYQIGTETWLPFPVCHFDTKNVYPSQFLRSFKGSVKKVNKVVMMKREVLLFVLSDNRQNLLKSIRRAFNNVSKSQAEKIVEEFFEMFFFSKEKLSNVVDGYFQYERKVDLKTGVIQRKKEVVGDNSKVEIKKSLTELVVGYFRSHNQSVINDNFVKKIHAMDKSAPFFSISEICPSNPLVQALYHVNLKSLVVEVCSLYKNIMIEYSGENVKADVLREGYLQFIKTLKKKFPSVVSESMLQSCSKNFHVKSWPVLQLNIERMLKFSDDRINFSQKMVTFDLQSSGTTHRGGSLIQKMYNGVSSNAYLTMKKISISTYDNKLYNIYSNVVKDQYIMALDNFKSMEYVVVEEDEDVEMIQDRELEDDGVKILQKSKTNKVTGGILKSIPWGDYHVNFNFQTMCCVKSGKSSYTVDIPTNLPSIIKAALDSGEYFNLEEYSPDRELEKSVISQKLSFPLKLENLDPDAIETYAIIFESHRHIFESVNPRVSKIYNWPFAGDWKTNKTVIQLVVGCEKLLNMIENGEESADEYPIDLLKYTQNTDIYEDIKHDQGTMMDILFHNLFTTELFDYLYNLSYGRKLPTTPQEKKFFDFEKKIILLKLHYRIFVENEELLIGCIRKNLSSYSEDSIDYYPTAKVDFVIYMLKTLPKFIIDTWTCYVYGNEKDIMKWYPFRLYHAIRVNNKNMLPFFLYRFSNVVHKKQTDYPRYIYDILTRKHKHEWTAEKVFSDVENLLRSNSTETREEKDKILCTLPDVRESKQFSNENYGVSVKHSFDVKRSEKQSRVYKSTSLYAKYKQKLERFFLNLREEQKFLQNEQCYSYVDNNNKSKSDQYKLRLLEVERDSGMMDIVYSGQRITMLHEICVSKVLDKGFLDQKMKVYCSISKLNFEKLKKILKVIKKTPKRNVVFDKFAKIPSPFFNRSKVLPRKRRPNFSKQEKAFLCQRLFDYGYFKGKFNLDDDHVGDIVSGYLHNFPNTIFNGTILRNFRDNYKRNEKYADYIENNYDEHDLVEHDDDQEFEDPKD